MMRGPAYDDSYLSRKMGGMQLGPPIPSYRTTPSYLQEDLMDYGMMMPRRWSDSYHYPSRYYYPRRSSYNVYLPTPRTTREVWHLPSYSSRLRSNWEVTSPYRPYLDSDLDTTTTEMVTTVRRSLSPSPTRVIRSTIHLPSAQTKLILNRVSLTPVRPPVVSTTLVPAMVPAPRGYLPPPRLPQPRYAPSYYDYDYGYGGGYGSGYGSPSPYAGYGMYGGYMGGGYTPLPTVPRMSRYDSYLDDDYEVSYPPRYRPGGLTEAEKDKQEARLGREVSPRPSPPQTKRVRAIEAPPSSTQYHSKPLTEGDRHLARMQVRYPTLSEPQMLQDQVDKMRIRLKALAYSLDPSGPVPEIVVPTRSKKSSDDNKYTSALESELPRLSTRRHHYYPEDEHMKDNLGIKCLSHYKNTRTQAEYWKPKSFIADRSSTSTLPDYSSKYSHRSLAKWEEPDTVYGPSTDRKPYSKVETGSSFFSTYGYTNRMKDTVGEKVKDYYYEGDKGQDSVRFSESSRKKTDTGDDEERKERRKKKKSRERDELSSSDLAAAVQEPSAAASVSALDDSAAAASEPAGDAEPEPELDDKEKKRLEKKKRKAEREAAAKAAMEAELEALATAELELARLEQESASLQSGEAPAAPAADETAAPEEAAEKCEFSERDQVAIEPCDPQPVDPLPSVEEVITQNEFQSQDLDQGVPLADSESPQQQVESVTVEAAPEGCGDSTQQECADKTWGEEQQRFDDPAPEESAFEAIPIATEGRGGEDNVIGAGAEDAWIAAATENEAAAVDSKGDTEEQRQVIAETEQQTTVEAAEEQPTEAASAVEEQQQPVEKSENVTATTTEDAPWEDIFASRDD